MKNLKKKLLLVLLSVFCLSAVLVGCGTSKTDVQIFVEKYKTDLDASMDQTLQLYGSVYSSARYYVEDNSLIYEYTYLDGMESLADTIDPANAQSIINAAKANDEKIANLKFDKYVYVYLNSEGKEILRVTSN